MPAKTFWSQCGEGEAGRQNKDCSKSRMNLNEPVLLNFSPSSWCYFESHFFESSPATADEDICC